MTTTTAEKPESKRPVERLKFGRIQASVWENKGKDGSYYTVTFERRYKDASGNWKSAHAFRLADLLTLAKACDKAHDALAYLANEAKREDSQSGESQ